MTTAINQWARRVGLMNTQFTRHAQKPDGSGYVVFLGSTQKQADRKRREHGARSRS